MTTVPTTVAKRAAQIASLHHFADWLDAHPEAPVPTLTLQRHHAADTEVESLAAVRNLAARLDVSTDEALSDRTVLRYKVNEHVWYELFAWHQGGRDNIGEMDRLRAEIAELRKKTAS